MATKPTKKHEKGSRLRGSGFKVQRLQTFKIDHHIDQNSEFRHTFNWAIRHYKHDKDRIPLICCLEFFQPGTLTPWPRPGSHTNSIDLTVVSV
jgi:oligoribonuclease NrnB/cAMP/cGMP phosphodiesterase (DHH superfamily)